MVHKAFKKVKKVRSRSPLTSEENKETPYRNIEDSLDAEFGTKGDRACVNPNQRYLGKNR